MKTESIIESFYNSFYSLIKVIEKEIDFDVIDQWQIKGVLEGRHEAFIIAKSQLSRIKDLQEQITKWDEKRYREDVGILLDSTDFILKEIKKSMDMDIIVNEIEDEKFKSVVQSKKIAGEFLININNVKNEIKFQLENTSLSKHRGVTNLATSRVKNRS